MTEKAENCFTHDGCSQEIKTFSYRDQDLRIFGPV